MNLKQLLERLDKVNAELDEIMQSLEAEESEETKTSEEAEARDYAAISKRVDELADEKRDLEGKIEIMKRKAELDNAANRGIVIDDFGAAGNVEKTETAEYRNAFYAYLRGEATAQQRDALITVENDAIAIPKSLDTKIWDCIHTEHPILADIDSQHTGVVLEVTRHTEITAGKAGGYLEGATVTAEENTFVNVTLSGKDFSKVCEISYAAAKMSQGALEDYLAQEIGADMSEAIAKYVFAQIKTDIGVATKTVAKGSNLTFADLTSAIGAVSRGSSLKIYCSRAKKFDQIVGMVDTAGQPVFRDGVTLGCDVVEDSAAGDEIYVLDPKKFVLNVVEPVTIETDKDIRAHKYIYSGYSRAEGTMRDTGAGAYIAFAQ